MFPVKLLAILILAAHDAYGCDGLCGQGEGDCDSDSDCLPGLTCDYNLFSIDYCIAVCDPECGNGAQCTIMHGGTKCACPRGYTGEQCEQAPYELVEGCDMRTDGLLPWDTCSDEGRVCGKKRYCEKCTFEQCQDHALSINADGFAYYGDFVFQWCRMCTKDDMAKTVFSSGYGVFASTKPALDPAFTTTYTCYQWSEEEKSQLSAIGWGEAEQAQACESNKGNVFAKGDDDLAPGCGTCWCCQPDIAA